MGLLMGIFHERSIGTAVPMGTFVAASGHGTHMSTLLLQVSTMSCLLPVTSLLGHRNLRRNDAYVWLSYERQRYIVIGFNITHRQMYTSI